MAEHGDDPPRRDAETEPLRPSARSKAEPPPPDPQVDAKSVVHALDPGRELGVGLTLRDLEGELSGPTLRLGSEKYRILTELGRGGMGTVYLAFDQDLRRRVALKVVRAAGRLDAARFIEEAQVMAQLDHPNIVPVFEVGLTAGGLPYYTMRVVRGETLADVLALLREGKDRAVLEYSLARRMQIFTQVAQTVSFAHARGVVHRDLKPSNVMVGSHGEVQVLDWGLAKVLDGCRLETAYGNALTRTGHIVGTPWYMPPEQAAGEAVDERADIYALGVMLYELLVLRRPFEGGASEVLAAVLRDEPEPPRVRVPERNVPLELERVCLRAMSKRREQRHATADALVAEIQGWLEAEADRDLRHARAEERARAGREKLESFHATQDEIERREAELVLTARRYKAWQPVSEKPELLLAERRLSDLRDALDETASQVVGTLGEALAFEGDNTTARSLLADYYWDRFLAAEAALAHRDLRFYRGLVAKYHDGRYARELRGLGSLALTSHPPGAEVSLHRLVEDGLVHVPGEESKLGPTPLGPLPLEMGRHVAVLRTPGCRDVRYPIHIARNRAWSGAVRFHREADIGAGFVHVPGGPFLAGGADESRGWSLPRAELTLDDFFIAVHPVTMGEYLEFLREVQQTSDDEAWARAPRHGATGGAYLQRDAAGRVTLQDIDEDGDRLTPRMPALGISWHDAVAYCAWRGRRDGRSYRLPTELEWEKAARGVDGRSFPWGDRFDPSLANLRESRRDRSAPVPVDDFPTDVSVYGVRGMAGNIRDWTSSSLTEGDGPEARVVYVVRGGAWNNSETIARSAFRSWQDPKMSNNFVGFRMARSPGEGHGES